MAQIKMDISEYEIMKDNKKLLEDSLNRERELQKQVESLNNEKIKALEDAKMKVVKITKTEHTEILLQKKPVNLIIQQLYEIARSFNYYSSNSSNEALYKVIEEFYTKQVVTDYPTIETTTHGLDDIIAELRKELQESIDKDVQEKLKLLPKIQKEHKEAILQNKELNSSNDNLQQELKTTHKALQILSDRLTGFKEKLNSKINFFTAYKAIKYLRNAL